MIIRQYIQCLTCAAGITLRISVGNDTRQEHLFFCPSCKEEIKVALKINFSEPSTTLEYIDNCQKGDGEGVVVNLSPNYPIKKESLHEDLYFSDINESENLIESLNLHEKIDSIRKNVEGPLAISSYELLGGNFQALSLWNKIKKIWSLWNNENEVLLDRLIPNQDNFKNPVTHQKDFLMMLFYFTSQFHLNHINEIDPIMNYSTSAMKSYPKEYAEFLEYYCTNLFQPFIKKAYDKFVEFFDNYNEYEQVAIFTFQKIDIPDTHIVSSQNFRKTKQFFGNAYELFTENIVLLCLIFNVAEGRTYDQFKSMSLEEYFTLDKANRCNPIKNEQNLYSICNVLESSIRNASHHDSMEFDIDTCEIVYKAGKKKNEYRISYANYLKKCYEIMQSLSVLIAISILQKNRYLALKKIQMGQ